MPPENQGKATRRTKRVIFPSLIFGGRAGGYFVQDLLGVQKFRWFSNTISFSLSLILTINIFTV